MKSRAAVAFAAGGAPEIPEADLGGPKAGAGQEIATRLSQHNRQKLEQHGLWGTVANPRIESC